MEIIKLRDEFIKLGQALKAAGFVESGVDAKEVIYDEIITIENDAAFEGGKEIAATEGILVGISSGAAFVAAQELAKRPENAGITHPLCVG